MPRSNSAPTERRDRLVCGLVIGAGICAAIGGLLGWARMTYPTDVPSLATASAGHPRIGLFLGGFMIVAGIVAIVSGRGDARRAWTVAGVASGLVVGAFAVVDLVRERNRAVGALIERSVRSAGAQAPALRVRFRALIDFSFRPGIYLAVAAGALAIAAGILLLLAVRSDRSAAREEHAPPADPEEVRKPYDSDAPAAEPDPAAGDSRSGAGAASVAPDEPFEPPSAKA